MPERRSQARSVPVLPRWLKRNVPKGNANHFTARLIEQFRLETVCDHAHCPNRMECYAAKTATVMILGDVCTRACRFCSVRKGKPGPVDADEPRRVAAAAAGLGLAHVVVTCVTRDDLPDGGAEHFVRTIAEIRRASGATIEVLPSDFAGNAVRGGSAAGRRAGGLQSQLRDGAAAVRVGPRRPGRLPLDAGHVPPHRPAGAGDATQNRPDARTGRDDGRASGDAGRSAGRRVPDADAGAILAALDGPDAGGALPAAGGIRAARRRGPPVGFFRKWPAGRWSGPVITPGKWRGGGEEGLDRTLAVSQE